jgi:predicted MFS family arabinose efflux permease
VATETDKPCSESFDMCVTEGQREPKPRVSKPLAFRLLAVVFTYAMLGTTLPTPIYVLYQAQYHLTSLLITIIFTAYVAGVLASLLFFGRLSDHFGRKRVLVSALILAAVSTLFFIFADSLASLLVGRFISGLGAGMMTGTATAGLVELEPTGTPRRATRIATAANMGGLGLGPLIAGLFAQLAPYPTTLVFEVYLVLLVVIIAVVPLLPETVKSPDHVVDLRPKLAVPSSIRGVYLQAAGSVFSAFTLAGLFSALVPSILKGTLHQSNLIVAGAIVFLLFGIAVIVQVAFHDIMIRKAMMIGLTLLIVSLALIETGVALASIAAFLGGTLVAGLGIGLAFMGSLAALNKAAPPDQRGALVSAFFVAAYAGLSVPVVAYGVLVQVTNFAEGTLILSLAVGLVLAGTLASLLRSRRSAAP